MAITANLGTVGGSRAAITMATSGSVSRDGVQVQQVRGAFATTHWSLVACAVKAESPDSRAALEKLCRTYWYPVYCFARRWGASAHDAEDLTQGFFADLLARDAIARADESRGRFRTFVLCSFQNFCSHARARAGAYKRGGGCEIISIEAMQAARGQLDADDGISPAESAERLFDRKWAISLIEQALATVQTEYAALGKGVVFEALNGLLRSENEKDDYAVIASRTGSTPGAIKVAAFRLRRRLAQEIRAEVAKTVVDPAAVEDEMQHLLAAVRT